MSDDIGTPDCREQEPTGLASLPNEILFLIIDTPDIELKDELYYLAMQCRRFYDVFFHIFLARLGVDTQHIQLSITESVEASVHPLKALQTAFDIDSITSLSLSFDFRLTRSFKVESICPHLNRLTRFIQGLKTLSQFTLSLGIAYSYRKGDEKFFIFFHFMERLLEVLTQRSCSQISISGSLWFDTMPPRTWLTEHLHSPFPSNSTLLDGLSLTRPKNHGKPELTTLNIMSPILLAPPISTWLFSTLAMSPLRHLEMSDLTIAWDSWPDILPRLAKAIPNLTHLAILRCNIVVTDLLSFICELRDLVSLCLDAEEVVFGSLTACPAVSYPTFPSLTTIRAPPIFMTSFYASPGGFPALVSASPIPSLRWDWMIPE